MEEKQENKAFAVEVDKYDKKQKYRRGPFLNHQKLFYTKEGVKHLTEIGKKTRIDANKSSEYNFKKVMRMFRMWHQACFPTDEFRNFAGKIVKLTKEDKKLGNMGKIREIINGNETWHSTFGDYFERDEADDRREAAEMEQAEAEIKEAQDQEIAEEIAEDDLLNSGNNEMISEVLREFEAVQGSSAVRKAMPE